MVARAARGAAAEAGGPRKERARGVPAPPAAAPETGRSRCPRDWAGGLPTELLEKVARAVPAGDRLCLRLVCKSWAAAGAEIAPAAGEKPRPPGKVTRAGWSDAAASVARAEMVLGGPEERKTKEKLKRGLCQSAAKGGQLEVLQWARAHGCPWDEDTCIYAAANGHLAVLQWARAHGCSWNEWACAMAARGGHVEVLKWLRAQGCPWNEKTCLNAALNGHLAVLQWARAHGCPWDEDTCTYAAWNGHLEVLQWARAHGCPWDAQTCANAAFNGHLEVLQWARAEGCPWDNNTCAWAALNGHL